MTLKILEFSFYHKGTSFIEITFNDCCNELEGQGFSIERVKEYYDGTNSRVTFFIYYNQNIIIKNNTNDQKIK